MQTSNQKNILWQKYFSGESTPSRLSTGMVAINLMFNLLFPKKKKNLVRMYSALTRQTIQDRELFKPSINPEIL